MDVQVEAHPPERGNRSIILASGCCTCCCCCCCCLHSVGAVVGATMGGAQALAALSAAAATADALRPSPKQGLGVDVALPDARAVSPGATFASFWAMTIAATLFVLATGSEGVEVTGLFLAILFPALLAVVLVLVLPVAILAGKGGMAVWGKMVLGGFLGMCLGVVVMIFLVPIGGAMLGAH